MQKSTSFTVQEAQKKLEHYCAYQERCHQEVVQKLKSLNMIPEAIDQIIGQLISDNYLNETRFAQSFARGKFRIKKWGKFGFYGSSNSEIFLLSTPKLHSKKLTPMNILIPLKSCLNGSGKNMNILVVSNAKKKYTTVYNTEAGKTNSFMRPSTTKGKRILKNKTEFLNSRFFRAWEPD